MTSKELTVGQLELTRDDIRDVYKILKGLECKNGVATIDEETLQTIKQKLFISYKHTDTLIQGLNENAEDLLDDTTDVTLDNYLQK